MYFLSALSVVIGIVSGLIGIYLFLESRKHPAFQRRGTIFLATTVVMLLLAFFLANIPSSPSVGAGRGINSTSTPDNSQQTTGVTPVQETPTPTPAPVGTVLCQADASHGWNGWGGTPDWKILNGVLLSAGTYNITEGPPTIVAPCPLGGRANYAVEATIQVLKNSYPTCFGIDVRGTATANGWQGYVGTIYVACNNGNNVLAFNIDNMNNNYLTSAPFSPGTGYHTYRVEAQNNQLRFLIDGAQILSVTDNTYTSGEQVGLWSFDAQLNVSSFKVIAL